VGARESGLRLTARGTWLHEGEPVLNEKIARFFHRALRRDTSGAWFLNNELRGHIEHVYVEVERTGLFVDNLWIEDGALRGRLNTGIEVALDPARFSTGPDEALLATLEDGAQARLLPPALEALAEHVIEEAGRLVLVLGDHRFPLP